MYFPPDAHVSTPTSRSNGLCHDLRMRAQLEKFANFFKIRRDDFLPSQSCPSLFLSYCNCPPRLKLCFFVFPVAIFLFHRFSQTFLKDVTELCRPGHGGRPFGSGRKRIYSSAVVRNRTWRRGHGQIWPDSIIFPSWVAAKLENAAMDTDSKSKYTRGINMTKKGGIRLVYVWAHCDGHIFAKHIEINCLDQRNLTSFQHDFAVDRQWLPATIAAVGELTVALLSV